MKNADSTFSKNIANWVNKKQQNQQYTVYMDWWYRDKWFFKLCRIVNAFLLWFTFILNFFIIYGNFYKLNDLSKGKNTINQSAALTNSTFSFVFATLLLIAGFVFFKYAKRIKGGIKRHKTFALISFILECSGCVIGVLTAVSALITNRISNMYATSVDGSTLTRINFELYGYHVIPLALILLTSLMLFIMFYKDSKDRENIYKQTTAEIYKKFIKDTPHYTEEMWHEYLESCDPSNPNN